RDVRDGDAPLATYSQGPALLSERSVVRDALWVIALDAEERRGQTVVRSAVAIESDWLIELFTDRIEDVTTFEWNDNQQRVDSVSRMAYGALVIEESRKPAAPSAEASKVLLEQLEKRGFTQVLDGDALQRLEGRVALARAHGSDVPEVRALLTEALTTSGATSFKGVREAGLLEQVMLALGPARAVLDNDVPANFKLANGKLLPIHYEPGKPPWVESYLQDFFGTDRGPRIARGAVALTIHLLSPNKRPLQVTSDLASFWDKHYPELKPALSRKYPRHHWPDDPRRAEAQAFKARLKT
ncbi:MAG: ATP-dependent helicase HrpB, partial [Clostridia bacterium]|nr:ATP-dependent helicase HrpB [Deltaproteobacteria bacterium]